MLNMAKWISSHNQNKCHIELFCESCFDSCTLVRHSWPVFVRCYLTVEFDPMPCFLSLSKWMKKETIMRAACGSVYTCVWSCECVRVWEPLRYQAIAHLSMTALLCQHSPSVFLSTLIHTIINELRWQKRPIYLNCSPALVFSWLLESEQNLWPL